MCCYFLGYPSEDRVLAETDGLFLISSRLSVITGRLNFYLLISLFHVLHYLGYSLRRHILSITCAFFGETSKT